MSRSIFNSSWQYILVYFFLEVASASARFYSAPTSSKQQIEALLPLLTSKGEPAVGLYGLNALGPVAFFFFLCSLHQQKEKTQILLGFCHFFPVTDWEQKLDISIDNNTMNADHKCWLIRWDVLHLTSVRCGFDLYSLQLHKVIIRGPSFSLSNSIYDFSFWQFFLASNDVLASSILKLIIQHYTTLCNDLEYRICSVTIQGLTVCTL